MKVSSIAMADMSIGEIVNLQAVDTGSVANVFWYIHQVWSAPLQLIVALAYALQFSYIVLIAADFLDVNWVLQCLAHFLC